MQEAPQHTQRGQLVYAPCTALPPGPGHVTASSPLALSRGSSPPRRLFLPPSESQDLSAAPFGILPARPRLPTPRNLPYLTTPLGFFSDRLAQPVMSRTALLSKGAVGHGQRFSGSRARRGAVGDSFSWRRLQRQWSFHDGEVLYVQDGGRPVGWRNCEVNSWRGRRRWVSTGVSPLAFRWVFRAVRAP